MKPQRRRHHHRRTGNDSIRDNAGSGAIYLGEGTDTLLGQPPKTMSSAKQTTRKQMIFRLGIASLVLAVLAAGCSQSGGEISVGSDASTRPSVSAVSVSSVLVPESTTTTQVSVASLNSIAETTTTATATTTTAATTTTTTTALLSPSDVEDALSEKENALSDRAVELVDLAVGVCGDLLELGCARALWDACMQVRIELGRLLELQVSVSVSEIVEIDNLRDDICSLFQMVQYWELYSILAAKYGENFYRPDTGFFLFRDELTNAVNPLLADPWTLRIFPRSCDDKCRWEYDRTFESFRDITRFARYLPDDSRIRLLRFTFDMRKIFSNLHPSAVPMSEDATNRILEVYEGLEVDDECYAPLLVDIFGHYKNGVFDISDYWNNIERAIISDCIVELCRNGNEKFFLDCYHQCSEEYREFFLDCNPGQIPPDIASIRHIAIPNDGDVYEYISGIYYSQRLLYWEVLKYACATGEIHSDAYADDACRTVAHNICRITILNPYGYNGSFDDDSFSALEPVICDLGRALERLPFENAKEECLRELEILLTSENSFLASDGRCNNATQRCLEFISQFSYRYCGGFEKYFHVEVFWKNIPMLCTQDNLQATTFGESECYNAIRSFCSNDINTDRHYYQRYNDEFKDADIPIRERIKISNVLCDTLLQTYDPVANASMSGNLSLVPNETQTLLIPIDTPNIIRPETIGAEQTRTQLTSNNFDSINSAATVCATNHSLPGDSECAIELWKSCFNLLYSKAKHESNKSEVHRSAEYVCTAAWIAELARMATVLSSSFPQDYQAGQFSQFSRYITEEAIGGSILSIDEAGKARPNLNPEDPAQDLAPEVVETLAALATSIAKLIQPYLPATSTANRQGNI